LRGVAPERKLVDARECLSWLPGLDPVVPDGNEPLPLNPIRSSRFPETAMPTDVRYLYLFGDYALDATERSVSRVGHPLALTPKAVEILVVLVERHGHIVEKDEMMDRVWPDTFVEEGNLARHVSTLRQALGDTADGAPYIETVPRRGYRFAAPVSLRVEGAGGSRVLERVAAPEAAFETVGGAVPLESKYYVARSTDLKFERAVERRDSIILIKGARQIGKTSLLARGLQHARATGARVGLANFEDLGVSDLGSSEALFLALGKLLSADLDLDSPKSVWDAEDSAIINFGRYMRRVVLVGDERPIVWALDEVDRLFTCPFGGEVFGLFRSWHNKRSLDPEGPWRKLTLAIAYATEAHLFITDPNRSPFNVGTDLILEDFTIEQVGELNDRYGAPLEKPGQVERLHALAGGHPYLTGKGLHEVASGTSFDAFERDAARDEGPMGAHLRRMLVMLRRDAELCDAVRGVLRGEPCPSAESFYRLRTAGVLTGDSHQQARMRCALYADYLGRHLL
jgi:DNA-binding winged helix-turn-helix (wHTH) protein